MKRVSTKGGITAKLVGLVLTALLASFVVTASVSTLVDVRRQADVETGRLTQTARVIGSLAADAVAAGDRAGSFRAIRSVSQMPGISYARIEADGVGLLAETGAGARLITDANLQADGRELSLWSVLTTGSIQVSAPVVSEGREVGTITLFGQTPELRERVLSTIWATLLGALIAVLAGLLVALRMARTITGPIVALADLVRGVDRTRDFSTRVDIEAEGEVAELVEGFETLLSGIRERDARIAAQVEGLEGEVAARTEELVVARDAAETANAAKSDFLAVMSHEIRTPLNGILALSEMLARSDLPQRQQRYADVIAKSGQSLLGIINDILDFSKVEAGKMDLEILPVDLAEVAEDVAGLFSEKAAGKGLDLAVFVDPHLPTVLADPVRLRQVIGNLVNNAIKFTETGGVLIAIDRAPNAADRLRIAVQDTGPGIPEDKLPTLFEAFTQADQSTTRKYGGTGLGLAICDRLVRSMGGEWVLASRLGKGSSFAFTTPLTVADAQAQALPVPIDMAFAIRGLPRQTTRALTRYLAAWGATLTDDAGARAFVGPDLDSTAHDVVVCADETEAANLLDRDPTRHVVVRPLRRDDLHDLLTALQGGTTRRRAARDDTARQISYPGARVLVVDDSEVNREVACEALSRLGVTTTTADDGQQAVERLRIETFDLVLMDGSMPVLDGFEATRAIRSEESDTGRPRATILALTAHVVGAGADAWKASGMDGVIHKPFTLDDLARAMNRFCGGFAVVEARPRIVSEQPVETAPAKAIASDANLFDPSVRAELAEMGRGGQTAFVDRIHALYATNAPDRLGDIRSAASAGDDESLARAAHALKSMSLSLGASAVATEASRIETAARAGDSAARDTDRIADLVARTLAAMAAPEAAGTPDAAIPDTPKVATVSADTLLATAIADGHIHMVYQPIVERNGAMAGKVEALVRWTDPVGGPIAPDLFIPRLEKEGGIVRLTDFVLDRVMQDLGDRPDIRVAVNVSATEFQEPGFADRVVAAVTARRFPPARLEIEVTETAMLDVEAARRSIDALREKGFSVALDDFGAGFTSLHALRELKFNTLKIDRSFVDRCASDTASAAIIHAVIGVGRALGMKVVCEGVETAAQADFLRIAGAHYMQGYHFHRPMAVDALPGLTEQAA